MLRFLREPRWIALIIAVPVGVVLCLMLSNWQWNRYEGRKDANQVQNANMSQEPTDIAKVIPVGSTVNDSNLWRPVTATGRYVPSAQVLVRKKPLNNSMGFWVVTPLVTADKTVVVVNRGWIKADSDAKSSPTVPPPPTGQVTVEGSLQGSVPGPAVRPSDIPVGQVTSLDAAAIGTAAGATVLPGYIDLVKSDPAQGGLTPIPPPEISEGSHLSYSLQWIAFAVMFIVGLVLLTRREFQMQRREKGLVGGAEPDEPDLSDEAAQPGESSRLPQDSRQ
ncbi:MAG: SURF1 family protein [Candidatus Nanopelagicales bacterium]